MDTVGLRTYVPPSQQSLAFNWQPSWFYEFGATHFFNDGHRLSAGYIYSENSVPEASFNPIVPDSDRHIFSVGLGRTYRSGWTWDIAYQYSWGPSRTINNPAGSPNFVANGTYEFTAHAISIAIGKNFR
jgi:long-chain fatty acid transport protein